MMKKYKKISNVDEDLEIFLEFLASGFVDLIPGNCGLAQIVPASNVGVFAEIKRSNFV